MQVAYPMDDDTRYLATAGRDARFDGWFFVAVVSTGIYCRPSCPSMTPGRNRVRFYPTAAAAQRMGFRACKRCRPDAVPGSPEWDRRADVVGRAMRLIGDGVVDREGVPGLARRLGYSPRQLNRLLLAEVGAPPLAVARAQRAHTARILLESTDLRSAEIAFAAGFSSVRQFNETIAAVFRLAPMQLRQANRSRSGSAGRTRSAAAPADRALAISLRLAYRPPLASGELFAFLAARAVPGLELGEKSSYCRTMRLPHGAAVARVRATSAGDHLACELRLADLRDLTAAVRRLRRLFDLDADPFAVDAVLGADPVLRTSVTSRPGLRVPGHVDGAELAIRAVLGQQVSVAGARTLAARLVADHGQPTGLDLERSEPSRLFPEAAVVAALQPTELAMPTRRAAAVVALAGSIADGSIVLDAGGDRGEAAAKLLELRGIGPWTVSYVLMRALGDPDAFLPHDLGVRRALDAAGVGSTPGAAEEHSRRWRPWRSYAVAHLWAGHTSRPRGDQAGRRTKATEIASDKECAA